MYTNAFSALAFENMTKLGWNSLEKAGKIMDMLPKSTNSLEIKKATSQPKLKIQCCWFY